MLVDVARARLILAVAAAHLGFAGVAAAKEPIVEYRHEVMEAIGGHTGALKQIISGDVSFPGDARPHVLALESLAKMVGHLFPVGSGKGDTHALPAIWEKPEEFAKAQGAFEAAVADLVKQADAPPAAMAAAFGAMVKTCKSCHDNFRKKD